MNTRFPSEAESLYLLNYKSDIRNKKRQKIQFAVFLVLLPILLCFQLPQLLSAQSLYGPFSYALFGNAGKMEIKEDVTISGNIFHNGKVKVKENAQAINGQLYAIVDVTIKEGAKAYVLQDHSPNIQTQSLPIYRSKYDSLLNQFHGILLTLVETTLIPVLRLWLIVIL